MDITISTLDGVVIGLYFTVIFGVAYWVTMQEKKAKGAGYSAQDYFLGGKNLGWFVIGASLFASNIGSEHLIGLSGAGARGAFPEAQFEILAALILVILAWVFVPFYIRSGVFTMPEFLEKRYTPAARSYLSVVSILAYVLTKISATIFAGALVFEVLGLDFWSGAVIVVLATGLYTLFGGLRAVLYTDMIQMVVLILGSFVLTYLGLQALGGWDEMVSIVSHVANADTSVEGISYLNLWRPGDHSSYPWTGVLFGAPILGIWYWCTDQFIVQRVLSAKNEDEAKKGAIFAGFLKLLPLFLFVIPGVIAYALYQKGIITNLDETDKALPAMVGTILPSGMKGLVLSGLLAALMSSLSSVFNSSSTLFTMDFYKKYRPNASQKELIRVGQYATLGLIVLSFIWIPYMKSMMEDGGVYKYIQSIQAYISPPIAAAFLFGLFFKKLNGKGAMLSLWGGFILGMLRLAGEYMSNEKIINPTEGSLVDMFVNSNFLHFAIFLFLVSAVLLFGGSMMGKSYTDEQLKNLVYVKGQREKALGSDPVFYLTLVLIVAVLVLWYVFSSYGIAG